MVKDNRNDLLRDELIFRSNTRDHYFKPMELLSCKIKFKEGW